MDDEEYFIDCSLGIQIISVSPTNPEQGKSFTVKCKLTNNCSFSVNATVQIFIDNRYVISKEGISISKYSNTTVEITVPQAPSKSEFKLKATVFSSSAGVKSASHEITLYTSRPKGDEEEYNIDCNLGVRIDSINPSKPVQGEPFTISVSVWNNCSFEVTANIQIFIDGRYVESKEGVRIRASGTVYHEIRIPQTPSKSEFKLRVVASTTTIGVRSGSYETTVYTTRPKGDEEEYHIDCNLGVRIDSISPSRPKAGEPFTIYCTVWNNCSFDVTANIQVFIDGRYVESKEGVKIRAYGTTYHEIRIPQAPDRDNFKLRVVAFTSTAGVKSGQYETVVYTTKPVEEIKECNLGVRIDSISPKKPKVGEPFTIYCAVWNNCSFDVPANIQVFIDDKLITSKDVTIKASYTVHPEFRINTPDKKEFKLRIIASSTKSGVRSGTYEITVYPEKVEYLIPEYRTSVKIADIVPDPPEAGQPFTVTVETSHNGQKSIKATINIYIDGNKVASSEISVYPYTSTIPVKFEQAPNKPEITLKVELVPEQPHTGSSDTMKISIRTKPKDEYVKDEKETDITNIVEERETGEEGGTITTDEGGGTTGGETGGEGDTIIIGGGTGTAGGGGGITGGGITGGGGGTTGGGITGEEGGIIQRNPLTNPLVLGAIVIATVALILGVAVRKKRSK